MSAGAPSRIPKDVDIVVQGLDGVPTYEELRSRAREAEVLGVSVAVCSVEDLRAMKRAAGRTRDLADLEDLDAARSLRVRACGSQVFVMPGRLAILERATSADVVTAPSTYLGAALPVATRRSGPSAGFQMPPPGDDMGIKI